jgi:hypothetical protein
MPHKYPGAPQLKNLKTKTKSITISRKFRRANERSKFINKSDTVIKCLIQFHFQSNSNITKNTISIIKDRQYKWFYQLNLNWWRKKIRKIMKLPVFQKNLWLTWSLPDSVSSNRTPRFLTSSKTAKPAVSKVRQSDISVIIRLTMEVFCGVPHNKTCVLAALR